MDAPTQRSTVIVASVGNLRDLGGLPTISGRRLAMGRLYRSSHFAALAASDAAALAALGLRTLIDLRGVNERESAPGLLRGPGVRQVYLPIEPRALGAIREKRAAGELDEAAMVEIMHAVYRRFVRDQAVVFGKLLRLLQDEANYPLVFHCTAGKDRTGFAAALVLIALGVPHDDIVADFMLSNNRWAPSSPSADWSVLGQVRAEYLRAALDEMSRGWASVDGYLAQQLGLDAGARERLAACLLEP